MDTDSEVTVDVVEEHSLVEPTIGPSLRGTPDALGVIAAADASRQSPSPC